MEIAIALKGEWRCTAIRRRLRGRVNAIRAAELLPEVTLHVPPSQIVAAIIRISPDRLGLEPGQKASAYVKASEITLAP